MKRVCFWLRLKKEMVEEYKKNHRVWPEMRQAIRETGIRNYSMFIRPDGLLIGYFEAENPQESLQKLGETEINRKWQEFMAPYFESGSGDLEKGRPEWLEQMFYLEG
ncbi:MAG: L-rhamnose mutarotase [Candidatus Omnitrophota bacterium]|nr:L-rhamnose mutarotase [Candidatus Omnitrophota bacterium]